MDGGASGDGGSGIAEVVRWFWEGKGGQGWFLACVDRGQMQGWTGLRLGLEWVEWV